MCSLMRDALCAPMSERCLHLVLYRRTWTGWTVSSPFAVGCLLWGIYCGLCAKGGDSCSNRQLQSNFIFVQRSAIAQLAPTHTQNFRRERLSSSRAGSQAVNENSIVTSDGKRPGSTRRGPALCADETAHFPSQLQGQTIEVMSKRLLLPQKHTQESGVQETTSVPKKDSLCPENAFKSASGPGRDAARAVRAHSRSRPANCFSVTTLVSMCFLTQFFGIRPFSFRTSVHPTIAQIGRPNSIIFNDPLHFTHRNEGDTTVDGSDILEILHQITIVTDASCRILFQQFIS